MYLQIISYIYIISSFLVSLFVYNKIKKTTEKWFVFYLTFIVLNEVIQFVKLNCYQKTTYANINFYDIMTYMFFLYWFYKISKNKKTVLILSLLYIICLIISLSLENIFTEYLVINTYTGTLLILVLVINYYYNYLRDKAVLNFMNDPKFWIATGLLIFNTGYLPILFLLSVNYQSPIDVNLIMTILNVFLYSFFIKGFLCYQKETN